MKKLLTIALLATLLLTGCKDFLIKKPTLTQSNDMSLSDYNGLVAATAGAYGPLVSSTWYGANLILESEIRAGNAMNPLSSDFQSGRMTVPQQMNYPGHPRVKLKASEPHPHTQSFPSVFLTFLPVSRQAQTP